MPAFEIRVSQLRGGDTLREGSTVPPVPPGAGHHPLLPFGTRLLNDSSSSTRLLGEDTGGTTRGLTAHPRTTRLI